MEKLGKEVKLIYENGLGEAIAYLFIVVFFTLVAIFVDLDSLGMLMVALVDILFGVVALFGLAGRNNQAIEFENGIYYRKGRKETVLLFEDIKEIRYRKRILLMGYLVSFYLVPVIVMKDKKSYVFPIMVTPPVQEIFDSYMKA